MKGIIKSVQVIMFAIMMACVGAGIHDMTHQAPVIETAVASPHVFTLPSDSSVRVIPIDSPAPAPTPAPETQSTGSFILSNILHLLIPIFVAITGVVVNGVLIIIGNHFKLQISQTQHELLIGFAQTGVAKAEAWAEAQKDKPSGNDKLNVAAKTINALADSQMGKSFEADTLLPYIEHAVATMFPAPDAPTAPKA